MNKLNSVILDDHAIWRIVHHRTYEEGHTGEPTFVGLMHTDSTSLFGVTNVLYLALFSF